MKSPLIRTAKHNLARENLIVSIGCGIVLAGLVLAFVVQATN